MSISVNTTAYNETQFSEEMADGMENWWWYKARNKTILKYIKRYNLNNLLDVGCGRGIVTSFLYDSGVRITGVELGDTTCINRISGVEIFFHTDVLALPEKVRNAVETLAMFDVIEHIEEPQIFLRKIFEKFPNIKKIIICVPARKELWTNYDIYYGHFRRYTLSTTRREMEEAGFKVDYLGYFFHTLYFLIFFNNLVRKNRHTTVSPPKAFLSKILNKLVSVIFYIETYIVPKQFIGSSIICVCTKK